MMAMEEEAKYVYPLLDAGVETLPSLPGVVKRYRGCIRGMPVDIAISGIGGVFAAMATTAVLTNSADVAAVFSCGCSGAHMPEQRAGDIVIGETVVPLSAEVVTREGKSRLCGVRCSMLDDATHDFPADPLLLRLSKEAARTHVCNEGSKQAVRKTRIDVGAIGSSDVWRQAPAVIKQVSQSSGSLCEEMEAHAVAQVCKTFGVPFVAIKDVANSEINPEDIQLEPTHAVVPESCVVGLAAAQVTARTIGLLADDVQARQSLEEQRAGKRVGAPSDAAPATKRVAA